MTAEEAFSMAVAAHQSKIEEVQSRLPDRVGFDRRRVAIVLVLATMHGAGDPISGLVLDKVPRPLVLVFVGTYFPGYVFQAHVTNAGVLLGLLSYRPADEPEVSTVLEVLERAASAGDGRLVWGDGR